MRGVQADMSGAYNKVMDSSSTEIQRFRVVNLAEKQRFLVDETKQVALACVDENEDEPAELGWKEASGGLCCFVAGSSLLVVWSKGLQSIRDNNATGIPDYCCIVIVLLFFCWIGLTARYEDTNARKRYYLLDTWMRVSLIIGAGVLFVGVLAFTMGGVAWEYPKACEFTYWTDGHECDEQQIAGDPRRCEVKPGKEKVTVDCDRIEFCLFGLWPCTSGAREFFAILAHALPAVCLFMYKFGTAHLTINPLNITLDLCDLVDVQDFWMLLLEDDVIINRWRKDVCKEDSEDDGSGCSGSFGIIWWATLVIFIFALVIMLALTFLKMTMTLASNSKLIGKLKTSFPIGSMSDKDRVLDHTYSSLSSFATGTTMVIFFSVTSLVVNALFLAHRLTLSSKGMALASTLLLKNIACIYKDIVLLRYRGRAGNAVEKHPWIRPLLSVCEELTGVDVAVDVVEMARTPSITSDTIWHQSQA